MKTHRNIFIAFMLNLLFSVFELFGGMWIGSIAIISDAVHDFGDAVSIGISFFLEKKSKKAPDQICTYGYGRYSVLGGAVTTLILLIGSVAVICHSVERFFNPTEIQYNGMIFFSCIGAIVNLAAALVTRKGDSLNQRAVNLHMMEDVLGWLVVLVGAIVMRFTNFTVIDPLLSIGVSMYILIHALQHFKEILDLFLEKTPDGIRIPEIYRIVKATEGVYDVHHIHIWSIDGHKHCATMHLEISGNGNTIKELVRKKLSEHGISHCVLELDEPDKECHCRQCNIPKADAPPCHSHHHH